MVELTFHNTMISAGKPIELELRGDELGPLREAAAALKRELVTHPGVYDVADSFRTGKRELQYEILPAAEAVGLHLEDLGRQVRQAFQGEEVQRIQRGRDDVRVVVQYPADERRTLSEVQSMRIRTADGLAVPFSSVARVSVGEGYSSIQRVDRQRVVTVTADVDVAVGNANEIVAALEAETLPAIAAAHPGIRFEFAGEQAEQRDFVGAMGRGQAIALLIIYGAPGDPPALLPPAADHHERDPVRPGGRRDRPHPAGLRLQHVLGDRLRRALRRRGEREPGDGRLREPAPHPGGAPGRSGPRRCA